MNTADLLAQFVTEARDCLEQVSTGLLLVERNPDDAQLLNELFRAVHTLKGNCGLFDFKSLELVVHAGEDLLDQVRHGALRYHPDMGDTLLEAMDFMSLMVGSIEQTGQVSEASIARATELAVMLRRHLVVQASAISESSASAASLPKQEMVEWLERIPAAVRAKYPGATAWRYIPEPECFFKGEDPWLYACQAPSVLHLDVQPAQAWPIDADAFSTWDCYRCNLDIVGLSQADTSAMEEHFRYVPEQVSYASVGDVLPAKASDVPAALLQAAQHLWREQLQLLALAPQQDGSVRAIQAVFLAILQCVDDAAARCSAQELKDWQGPLTASKLAAWGQQQALALAVASSADAAAESPAALMPSSGASMGVAEESSQSKIVKVGQEKIDLLMDLIGEMVVAKNALPYLAQRAESVFEQRDLAREIKAQYAVINRIAEDMQHAIMQVRMMPVGAVFQRFARLVRDTSKRLNKDVRLVIEGEDTEADKNVIEALADPLIHILRNSLDHGIELPQARLESGKTAQGTICVKAKQEADRVLIEISDDGAGVNPQRVRAKAVERGLIPADKADQLSDTDAVQLVFLPGFSTAESITDLSGRGVGMDVVRSAVERIHGQVELSSVWGQGTQLRLSLPLSMAVTNVMVIEAGGRRFGVPMDLIVETVRIHTDDIHHFKQVQTTVLRGRIVPLRSLDDLLRLDSAPAVNADSEHAVLVVRLGAENVGLLVDQFHGATDIILKPLEGVLAGLCGFAGTALMGDGSVLMVLNPKELR